MKQDDQLEAIVAALQSHEPASMSSARVEQAARSALAREAQDARASSWPRVHGGFLLAAMAAGALLVALPQLWLPLESAAPKAQEGAASLADDAQPDDGRLHAGGLAGTLSEGSRVTIDGEEPQIRITQEFGTVLWEVESDAPVPLRVGGWTILGMSGRFSVETADPKSVVVAVIVGGVQVDGPGGSRRLDAGTSARLEGAPAVDAVEQVVEVEEVEASPPSVDPAVARRPPARASRSIDPESLLDRAIDARRAGREDEAAELYEDFVSKHPRHPRAPTAWMEVGRFRRARGEFPGAAQAFQSIPDHWPSHALALDGASLAAEMWHRAGRDERAAKNARFYLERAGAGGAIGGRMQALAELSAATTP